jgi:hypothetical protein
MPQKITGKTKDLFRDEIKEKPVKVNIYADEVMNKECPYRKHRWHYIGIIVEDFDNPLLDDIITERYCNNFDKISSFYKKNNKIIHWADISSVDEKNIIKRWFEYILNPTESEKKFYSYILGINDSLLNKEEFGLHQEFNSKYNRFFRSVVRYALKCFFPKKRIIIGNIYHERGQQQNHEYFPWHVIYKLKEEEPEIFESETEEIIFLSKDHNEDKKANIIQLCDCILGVSVSLLHGIEKSNRAEYRSELAEIYLPLFKRMIENRSNVNSSYKHSNRIMMRFFPREKTMPDDIQRLRNQFYTIRAIKYMEDISRQGKLL